MSVLLSIIFDSSPRFLFSRLIFKVEIATFDNVKRRSRSELDMDWIHPWIGLDWIGSNSESHFMDRIGSHNHYFYRAMHFSAKRGIVIACRLSVRPSVCNVGGL